jgi:hypothetical protein
MLMLNGDPLAGGMVKETVRAERYSLKNPGRGASFNHFNRKCPCITSCIISTVHVLPSCRVEPAEIHDQHFVVLPKPAGRNTTLVKSYLLDWYHA